MQTIHIVEERAPYLRLQCDDDQFVVVEHRASKLYPLHCGRRKPETLIDTAAEYAVPAVHPVGYGCTRNPSRAGCSRRSRCSTERWPRPSGDTTQPATGH